MFTKKNNTRRGHRNLRLEGLEGRQMMAADWCNAAWAVDVNNDLALTRDDAIALVDDLIANGSRTLDNRPDSSPSPLPFLDVNGDGRSSPSDLLAVVNSLLKTNQISAEVVAADQSGEVASDKLPSPADAVSNPAIVGDQPSSSDSDTPAGGPGATNPSNASPTSLNLAAVTTPSRSIAQAETFFMKVDGIRGESRDAKHRDWVAVSSFAFGGQNTVVAGATLRQGGKVDFSDFSIVAHVDRATPGMLLSMASRNQIKDIEVEVVGDSKGGLTIERWKLEDVVVTEVTLESDGRVEYSLDFAKVRFEYTVLGLAGNPGPTVVFAWDVSQNKKIQ